MQLEELSAKYNIEKDKLLDIKKNINNKDVLLYAMSGKMGSGKDTVGNKIYEKLKEKEYSLKNLSYSELMKNEMNQITSLFNKTNDVDKVAKEMNAKKEEISKFLELLNNQSIYERTPEARNAIQFWGTNVRRKQNSNYWITKLSQEISKNLADGYSVYVSDVRFENEADSILNLGGKIIRLEANQFTRIERIKQRDNLVPSDSQLNHSSEVSLDNYNFERIFDGKLHPNYIRNQAIKYILTGE